MDAPGLTTTMCADRPRVGAAPALRSRPQEGPFLRMRLAGGDGSSSGRADLEEEKGRLKGSSAGKAVFEDERGT